MKVTSKNTITIGPDELKQMVRDWIADNSNDYLGRIEGMVAKKTDSQGISILSDPDELIVELTIVKGD